MKKCIVTIFGVVLSTTSGLSADLQNLKNPTESKQDKGSMYEGIYIGANAAGGAGQIIEKTNGTFNYPYFSNYVSSFSFSRENTSVAAGALVGAQIGYNHVLANRMLLGVEADIDWADVFRNRSYGKGSSVSGPIGFAVGGSSRTGLDWQGTVRMRLGYAAGAFLPYVTGGIAYGQLSSVINNYNLSTTYGVGASTITTGSSNVGQFGWSAGAGLEYMIAENWSVRGEYLYTSLGGITRNDNIIGSEARNSNFFFFVPSGTTQSSIQEFGIHQGRIGVNYHTDWLSSSSSVMAKY